MLFRDLDGNYYDIPEADIDRFRLTAEQAKERLGSTAVSGMAVGSMDDDELAQISGGSHTPMHQRTTSNQPGPVPERTGNTINTSASSNSATA